MVKNRKAAITDERGLSVVLSHTLKSAIEFLKNNKIRAIEDIAGTQEKLGRDTYYVALIVFKTNKQDIKLLTLECFTEKDMIFVVDTIQDEFFPETSH